MSPLTLLHSKSTFFSLGQFDMKCLSPFNFSAKLSIYLPLFSRGSAYIEKIWDKGIKMNCALHHFFCPVLTFLLP